MRIVDFRLSPGSSFCVYRRSPAAPSPLCAQGSLWLTPSSCALCLCVEGCSGCFAVPLHGLKPILHFFSAFIGVDLRLRCLRVLRASVVKEPGFPPLRLRSELALSLAEGGRLCAGKAGRPGGSGAEGRSTQPLDETSLRPPPGRAPVYAVSGGQSGICGKIGSRGRTITCENRMNICEQGRPAGPAAGNLNPKPEEYARGESLGKAATKTGIARRCAFSEADSLGSGVRIPARSSRLAAESRFLTY